MNIGAHVPMHDSFTSQVRVNADVVQIHLGSPRQWGRTKTPKGTVASRVYVHAPYLINFSSGSGQVVANSLGTLIDQCKEAANIRAQGVVIHGGSWKGQSQYKALGQWERALSDSYFECKILVENAANGKHSLTRALHDLDCLWGRVGKLDHVGFCLDTAHLWANLDHPDGAEEYIKNVLDLTGGIDLVHANGSSAELNSGVDRHSPLATSVAPAEWVAWCCQLSGVSDAICETTDPINDIKTLRRLLEVQNT